MSNAELVRLSGLSIIAGAVVFSVHIVARSVITAGVEPISAYQAPLWVPVNTLGLIGAVLVLLGLPGSYARIAGSGGWVGLTGIVLITVAWLFFGVFLSFFSVLVAPWLARNLHGLFGPSLPVPIGIIAAFIVALVANLAGTVLLAFPFLQDRVQPRWVGYLLPISGIWMVVGDLVAPSGPASNFAINVLSNLGVVLLVVALTGLSLPRNPLPLPLRVEGQRGGG